MGINRSDKNEEDSSKRLNVTNNHTPFEEIIFHFTNQNVNLELLTQKISEFLKRSWSSVEIHHNKAYPSFEIVSLESKKLRKFLSENEQLFLLIKGNSNDFTITFFLKIGGNMSPPDTPVHISGMVKLGSRINLLRKIEEFVYELSGTINNETREK